MMKDGKTYKAKEIGMSPNMKIGSPISITYYYLQAGNSTVLLENTPLIITNNEGYDAAANSISLIPCMTFSVTDNVKMEVNTDRAMSST